MATTNPENYRKYLPNLSIPRFTSMKVQNAHQYASTFKDQKVPPWFHALYLFGRELLKEPFKGITNDGIIRQNLFTLQDEGIPIGEIVHYTKEVLSHLEPYQLQQVMYHIDSPDWRTWSNPEHLLFEKGIRLDEMSPEIQNGVLSVLRSTFSPEGYEKALAAMRINGFLGELVQAPTVLNEFSYNFVVFGEPSTTSAWGYSLYGHHLSMCIFFYKTQIVISPWFTGAEPNEIDAGKYAGTKILQEEEALGLQLMQSLSTEQQRVAQTYKEMRDPLMSYGRWNHDDQRHLGGAFRDNRIVAYEGIVVDTMDSSQKSLILAILNQYLLYLPRRARDIRLKHVTSFFAETYFSWIGGFQDSDPFYYRIQSPVILVEFDHHSGVFLNNAHPAKFHIHTLLRTPNAGDYGMALRPLVTGMDQAFTWAGDSALGGVQN